jgi:hypothetical protein
MSESTFDKYKKPPAAVDFEAAKKKVRDQDLVASLESFYKASKPPIETFAMPEQEKTEFGQKIAYLKDLDAVHKEFLPVLEVNRNTLEIVI